MWLWPSWRPSWRPFWRPSWIWQLQLQNKCQKLTVGVHYYEKSGTTWHSTSNSSNVKFYHVVVAILVVILDFSVSSRIFVCYPPDIYYRGPNDVKSTIKKIIIPSRVRLEYQLWHPDYIDVSINTRDKNDAVEPFATFAYPNISSYFLPSWIATASIPPDCE